MKVVIDDEAGCCPGVRRAIRIAEEKLDEPGGLASLGPLIHNRLEVERLKSKGLTVLDQESWENQLRCQRVLIRTHGISKDLRNKLLASSVTLIDATCPIVRRSQRLVEKYYKEGYQIVIVGKRTHPEVVGLLGHCGDQATVAVGEEDLKGLDPTKKTFLLAQTTVNREKYQSVKRILEEKIPHLTAQDTTCRLINNRHHQVKDFARAHEVVLFVGGKNSSNTKYLFDICWRVNKNSHLVENESEIDFSWFDGWQKVGVSGGASTPRWQLEKIRKYILENQKGGRVK